MTVKKNLFSCRNLVDACNSKVREGFDLKRSLFEDIFLYLNLEKCNKKTSRIIEQGFLNKNANLRLLNQPRTIFFKLL